MEDKTPADRLLGFFALSNMDGPVDEDAIQEFLDLAAATHHMPPIASDGRAKAIFENGFQSRHSVALLTESDLIGMRFLAGHARVLARYLGGAKVEKGPVAGDEHGPIAADALTAVTAAAHSTAALMASAVMDAQSKVELNGGGSGGQASLLRLNSLRLT
jgi:hypothetical protein